MELKFVVNKSAYIPEGAFAHYIGDNIISTTNWPDEQGNANLTSSQGTRSILTDGPNGHSYMRMTASNSYIYTTTAAVPPTITVAVVLRNTFQTYFDSFGPWFVGNRFSAGDGWNAFSTNFSAGSNQVTVKGMGAVLMPLGSVFDFPSSDWQLHTFRYQNIANWYQGSYTGHLRRNQTDIMTGSVVASNNSGTNYMMLGSGFAVGVGLDIAEFIYYKSVLNDSAFESLERFLMQKYLIS